MFINGILESACQRMIIAVSRCGPRTSFPQELAAFRAVTSLNGRYSEPCQRIQRVGVVAAEHPLPVR